MYKRAGGLIWQRRFKRWVTVKLTATSFVWAIEDLSKESMRTCCNKHIPNTGKLAPQLFTILVKTLPTRYNLRHFKFPFIITFSTAESTVYVTSHRRQY